MTPRESSGSEAPRACRRASTSPSRAGPDIALIDLLLGGDGGLRLARTFGIRAAEVRVGSRSLWGCTVSGLVGALLEGKRPQHDVDGHVVGGAKEDGAVPLSEARGLGDAAGKARKEPVDDRRLAPKAGDDGEVDVVRDPGLAPAQNGEPADEEVAPAVLAANPFELRRRDEERVHRIRARSRCRSRRPAPRSSGGGGAEAATSVR